MTFRALVLLFVRDLLRRRLLWGIVVLAIAAVAIYNRTAGEIESMLEDGIRYDIATRQAASRLDALADQVRGWLYFIVVILSAQVAPESRRNGTTQFVLCAGVQRGTLARAQLGALSLLVTAIVLVVHAGFSVAQARAHAAVPIDVATGWIALLVPMLAAAACVFALSLTAGAVETYIVFLVLPFVGRALPQWMGSGFKSAPLFLVRAMENVALLFPSFWDLARWPHWSEHHSAGPPFAQWALPTMHAVLATTFWVALGVFLHRRHDFGSRTALK